jgi:hypothetical protein
MNNYWGKSLVAMLPKDFKGTNDCLSAKYKWTDKSISVQEVLDELPDSGCAMRHFKKWYEACVAGSALTLYWLERNPEAAQWAIEHGFVVEVKPRHDWSGLRLIFHDGGDVTLRDQKSNKSLIGFRCDGEVRKSRDAQGGAGDFDEYGRLIINAE